MQRPSEMKQRSCSPSPSVHSVILRLAQGSSEAPSTHEPAELQEQSATAAQRSVLISAPHFGVHLAELSLHRHHSLVEHVAAVSVPQIGTGAHCAFAAIGDVEGTCWHVCGQFALLNDMQLRVHPVAVFSQMP